MATPYYSDEAERMRQAPGAQGPLQAKIGDKEYRGTWPTPAKDNATAVQPTAPTSVAAVNNAVAEQQNTGGGQMVRSRYNPGEDSAGLRAVLAPYQSRGNFRNLSRDERNSMQMGYRDIANMRGLSNRQRQQGLLQMKNRMAEYGMKPTFDLSSEKGLSQRQIMENRINNGVLDRMTLDRQQAIAGANAMHDYNRRRYLEDYSDILWE